MASAYDIIIAGGGPAGLSAGESAAQLGASVLIVEQSRAIGTPTRTSGGSFLKELLDLGVPSRYLHPLGSIRFAGPGSSASFSYPEPVFCVIDVHGLYQHLAAKAAAAAAQIRVGYTAITPLLSGSRVTGVRMRDHRGRESEIASSVLIDATGYHSTMLKGAGLYQGAERFGVGAEVDLYAPHYDQTEAVLLVGSRVAPCGYAWAFPWGNGRVRLGVGVIRKDSNANPDDLLEQLRTQSRNLGMNFKGAQPIEYHQGLIPSDGPAGNCTGDGIIGIGDAAGHCSALVGEGIRWAIEAGRRAGRIAAECVKSGQHSRESLGRFEEEWNRAHGLNLRIAYAINRRIAAWPDEKWDKRVELLRLLTPAQFASAIKSDFTGGWLLKLLLSNPAVLRTGAKALIDKIRNQ